MGFSFSYQTATPATRNPSYFYQTASGYIFRYRIPEDLKELVGRVEFRYSLKTGSLRIAKRRVLQIVAYVQNTFQKLRNNIMILTPKKINELVRTYIHKTLQEDEDARVNPLRSQSQNSEQAEIKSTQKVVQRWLGNKDHEYTEIQARTLLADEGLQVDTTNQDELAAFKKLSREMMIAFSQILNVRELRSKGDYSLNDEQLIPALKHPENVVQASAVCNPVKPVEKTPQKRFNEVLEYYLRETETGDNWTEKTRQENTTIFTLFTRVHGDIELNRIDRKLMSEYKNLLMRLPPNMNKSPKYKEKTIEGILAMKPEKTISWNTINKYLRRLGGFFNYATANGYMDNNPAEGLQIKSTKRQDQERGIFETKDLKKLFTESPDYLEDTHNKAYRYWAPLIALFTGCRLEETCQLHLDDIRQEKGIWVFDINDKMEKKLKPGWGNNRLIPIHPTLLELGIVKYADYLRKKRETRFFFELNRSRDGYGKNVSRWFNSDYRKQFGITEKEKVFHSLRHTFINNLKQQGSEYHTLLPQLAGHTGDSQTYDRYGKRYSPDLLLEEGINKLDYDGIDFTVLKSSKYSGE